MPLDLLTSLPRARIRRWVLSAFPRDPAATVDYDRPRGDPGLFGEVFIPQNQSHPDVHWPARTLGTHNNTP